MLFGTGTCSDILLFGPIEDLPITVYKNIFYYPIRLLESSFYHMWWKQSKTDAYKLCKFTETMS